MDQRISKSIANSLNVNHYKVASCELPREVTQCLSDLRLFRSRTGCPSTIIVLLDVLSLNEVFCKEVIQLSAIQNFIDEGADKVSEEVRRGDLINKPFIKLTSDEIANRHLLQFTTHTFNVVLILLHFLTKLENHFLVKHAIVTLESISERALTEWVLSYLDRCGH